MPMQYVGKVGVKVVPDTKEWDAVKRRIEGTDLKAEVNLGVSWKEFNEARARAKKLKRELEESGGMMKLDLDIKQARANLDRVKDTIRRVKAEAERDVKMKIDVEQKQLDSLKAEMTQLKTASRNAPKLDVQVGEAKRKLEELQELRRQVDGKRSAASYDIDISSAERKLAKLKSEYKSALAMSSRREKLDVDVSAAQEKLASLQAQLKSAVTPKQKAQIDVNIERAKSKLEYLKRLQSEVSSAANRTSRLDVDISSAEKKLAELRRAKETALPHGDAAKLDVDITQAQRKLDFLRQEHVKAHMALEKSAVVDVDISEAKAKLATLKNDLKDAGQRRVAKLKLDVDKRRAEEKLHDLTKKREATINADADTAAARAKLAVAARTRFVKFAVHVSGAEKITAMLKAMSGVKLMERFRDGLLSIAENADKFVLKLGSVGPAVITMGAAFTRLIPATVSFGAGLAKIVPLMLTFVPAAAGAAAAVYTIKAAFTELNNIAGVSREQFLGLKQRVEDFGATLKTSLSQHFFDAIDPAPLNSLLDRVLPQLKSGLEGVSEALGAVAQRLANDLNGAVSDSALVPFFTNVQQAIKALGPAVSNVVIGLVSLANIASGQFPDLARAASEASERFRAWATDTDKVTDAIKKAQVQFGYAWTTVKNLWGALAGLATAAQLASGSDGLQGVAEATGYLNTQINSIMGQDGLRRIFSGALGTMTEFRAQLPSLSEELLNIGRTAETIGPAAGGAFGVLLRKLNEIMLSPAVAGGLKTFFDGVREGLSQISSGAAADGLSQVLANLGAVAANLGPILNALIARFLQIAASMTQVMVAISSVLAAHPALVNAIIGIVAVVGTVGTVMKVWGAAMTALGPVLGALGVSTEGLGTSILTMGGPLGLIIRLAAGAALAFIGLNAAGVPVGDMMDALVMKIGQFVQQLPGMITGFAQQLTGLIQSLAAALPTLVTNILQAIPQVIGAITALIPALVSALVTAIPAILQAGVQLITGLVQGITTALPQVISAVMQAIPQIITAIVTAIPQLLQAGVQMITGIIQGITQAIPQIITAITTAIPLILNALLIALPQLLQAGIQIIVGLVQGVTQAIPQLLDAIVQAIPLILNALLIALPQLLQAGIQIIVGLIQGVTQAIPQLLDAVVQAIPQILTALIGVLPILLEAGIQIVIQLITGLVQALPQLLTAGMDAIPQLLGAIIQVLPQLITAGIQMVPQLISGFMQALPQLLQAGRSAIPQLLGAVMGVVGQLAQAGIAAVSHMASGLSGSVGQLISAGASLIGNLVSSVTGMASRFLSAGAAIVHNIAAGIRSAISSVSSAISSVMSTIRNFLPHSPAKEGPFSGSGWGGWGEAITGELARGLEATQGVPARAMQSTMQSLADRMDMAGTGYGLGQDLAKAIADGLSAGGAKVSSALNGLPLDMTGLSVSLAGASGVNGAGGTVVNQNFDTKVYRSGDDLYTAAPILYRQAERELRSVTR
nr:MAG TPA: tail tape measure protein [Caudoviricetes sp.]